MERVRGFGRVGGVEGIGRLGELQKSEKMEEGEESEQSEELEEVVKSGFGGSRGVGLDCNEGESRRNSAKQTAVVLVSL